MAMPAVQYVKRMRGGAQSHLMRCEDLHYYVVKFLNNPQHPRVLANELLATRLAELVGLPVPATETVEVGEWLIARTPELHMQLANGTVRCQPGLHFGSRYVVDPCEGQVFDYMPAESFSTRVRNPETFAGILAFDKWTGNADGRQVAFWRYLRERKYMACFIDQGYCFNAGEWTFPDYPLRGVYADNEPYISISGWKSFEPWLARIENLSEMKVCTVANSIPPEWYCSNSVELEKLIHKLLERRHHVRELIENFRRGPRRPFPHWQDVPKAMPPRLLCGR
jgi:hypothetical protein